MEQLSPGDPQQIGAYRLLARLGAGGMGQVFLARSERGRTVAVKLVRRDLAERAEFRARFRHEVAAARRVGGEWTAPVLDADTEAEVPWLATGYVAGPSLQAVVANNYGPLPERSVRILAAGLAYALQDIHAAGLIHRDLKPSNVLITLDGPRVIDFGIARALEPADGSAGPDGSAGDAAVGLGASYTRTGELIGSPGFMAPEQLRGEAVTAACDVFCLGSVLAYAAGGALPFGDADGEGGAAALLLRIADSEPDLSRVPESLRDLVRDCLHKNPAARPAPADLLARVGAGDTVADGKALEPWLPAALVAQLGRHAVELLDREDPRPARPAAQVPPAPPALPTLPASRVPQVPALPPAPHVPQTPQVPAVSYVPQVPAGPHGPVPPADRATLIAPSADSGPLPGSASGQGYPYGYGQAGYGFGPPPVYEQPPRRTASSVFLVAIAVVVALLAGGSVYAFMTSTGDRDDARRGTTAGPAGGSEDPKGGGQSSGTATGGTTEPQTPATGPTGADRVPDAYLGTWDGSAGAGTWRITLSGGRIGDTVMTLTGTGTDYACTWSAALRAAGPPVELEPSQVVSGDPAHCSPGQWSRLTLRPDGTLERELVGSGKPPVLYTKSP
ncbi:protein kinase domain-containing protein [Streptomyces sp. NPDC002073]